MVNLNQQQVVIFNWQRVVNFTGISTLTSCVDLTQNELEYFETFINTLSGISQIETFANLYQVVFNPDTTKPRIHIETDSITSIKSLESTDLEQIPVGYIAEASTMFATWLYMKYLSLRDVDTTPTDILFPLLDTLFHSTNGLGFGLNDFSDATIANDKTSSEWNEIKQVFNPTTNIGKIRLPSDPEPHPFGTGTTKKQLLDLMKNIYTGSPNNVPEYSFGTYSSPSSNEEYYPFIKKHLELIRDIATSLIQQKSNCIFKQIIRDNTILRESTLPPNNLITAAGDGTSTQALMDETNNGIILFSYDYDENSEVLPSKTKSFDARNNSTTVHFSIFGLSYQHYTYVSIEKNGINCLFRAYRYSSDSDPANLQSTKLQPVSDTDIIDTTKTNEIERNFFNDRNIAHFNTTTNCFEYPAGNRIASYDTNNHDLTYDSSTSTERINVSLYSHITGSADETELMVNIVDGPTPPPIIVTPVLHEYFDDDKFELKTTIWKNLFGIDVSDVTHTSDTSDTKNIDALIDYLISSIAQNNITITLDGGFIGQKDESATSKTQSKIKSDSKYYFSVANRYPEKLPPNDDKTKTEYSELRYSFIKITYAQDYLNIYIISYVSPVWSRLDERIYEAKYGSNFIKIYPNDKTILKTELDLITKYGKSGYVDDSFVKVGQNKIPSYNAVLCAFRSFGVTEAIIKYMEQRAIALGKNSVVLSTKLETVFKAAKVSAESTTLGRPVDIDYDMYNKFKTYTEAEKSFYE